MLSVKPRNAKSPTSGLVLAVVVDRTGWARQIPSAFHRTVGNYTFPCGLAWSAYADFTQWLLV